MSPGFEERAVPYEVARASLAGRLTETVRVGVPRYNRCIRLAVAFVSVVRADDADAESAADQSQPNHPLLSPAPAASMARSGMVVEIRVPTLSVVSSLAPGHRDVPSCDRTLRHGYPRPQGRVSWGPVSEQQVQSHCWSRCHPRRHACRGPVPHPSRLHVCCSVSQSWPRVSE